MLRVPAVLSALGNVLVMEYVAGSVSIKSVIDGLQEKQEASADAADIESLGVAMGRAVGELHSAGIIHGDLTTSNMLHQSSSPQNLFAHIWLIDFGLAQVSRLAEDRAVDLYVMERALTATHSLFSSKLVHPLWGYLFFRWKTSERVTKWPCLQRSTRPFGTSWMKCDFGVERNPCLDK